VLTPVADGVAVHRSELLQNQTVVVHGRAGALVVEHHLANARSKVARPRHLGERGLIVVRAT
jgi:hypothetical protein